LIIIEASIAVRVAATKTHFRFLSHKSLLKNEDRKTSRRSRRSFAAKDVEFLKAVKGGIKLCNCILITPLSFQMIGLCLQHSIFYLRMEIYVTSNSNIFMAM
jgi:hypothetical protein